MEANELGFPTTKLEFLWLQCDTLSGTLLKEIKCVPESILDAGIMEQSVVNALMFPLEVFHDVVELFRVRICC